MQVESRWRPPSRLRHQGGAQPIRVRHIDDQLAVGIEHADNPRRQRALSPSLKYPKAVNNITIAPKPPENGGARKSARVITPRHSGRAHAVANNSRLQSKTDGRESAATEMREMPAGTASGIEQRTRRRRQSGRQTRDLGGCRGIVARGIDFEIFGGERRLPPRVAAAQWTARAGRPAIPRKRRRADRRWRRRRHRAANRRRRAR